MEVIRNFFAQVDIWQVLSSFIFLIAIIDPFGNIPITIAMEKRGMKISAWRVCLASLIILLVFLFLGEWVLKLFGVQIEYFAIAGGFIIFLMALEMILDITIFQNDKLEGEMSAGSSIVPLAFPMYAGPGAFTALLNENCDEMRFCEWNNKTAGETVFEIRVFKVTDWDKGVGSDKYTLIYKDNRYAYTFINHSPESEMAMENDQIKTAFSLLDKTLTGNSK